LLSVPPRRRKADARAEQRLAIISAVMTNGTIKVTIRDGRAGRIGGPDGVTPEGWGEILGVVERVEPVDIGDVIAFDDGTKLVVIGVNEAIGSSWEQVAHVGNLP